MAASIHALKVAMKRRAAAVLTAFGLSCTVAGADPAPAPLGPVRVALKGGTVLHGKVVGMTTVDGKQFLVLSTDFGEVRVPQAEVTAQVSGGPPVSTFVANEIRVLRMEGPVRLKRAGSNDWLPISEEIAYAGLRGPPPTVRPGDSLRTGPAGAIELLLHKDAWVRVGAESEVEIPAGMARASLTLLRGVTLHDVSGQPRGETFRMQTPTAVLGVRGTRFQVWAEQREGGVAVLHGEVEVEQHGTVRTLETGAWSDSDALRVRAVTPSERSLLQAILPIYPPPDDMVYVPPGRYLLGSAPGPRTSVEADPRRGTRLVLGYAMAQFVEVRGFLIDRREVTLADFATFLAAKKAPRASPPARARIDREPMYDCTHDQAEQYAMWLGKQLPTATQWEAAARGDGRPFPWGREPSPQTLEVGRWTGSAAGLGDDLRWEPPPAFPPVDDPTLDVSPFGVEALVTGVPEYVRHGIEKEPIWPLLTAAFREAHLAARRVYVRGVFGSVLAIAPHSQPLGVGWRCVIDLPTP